MIFLHITKERITQEYDMDSGTLAIPIDSIGETKLDATSGTLQVIEATFKCTNICMLDALKGQYVFLGVSGYQAPHHTFPLDIPHLRWRLMDIEHSSESSTLVFSAEIRWG